MSRQFRYSSALLILAAIAAIGCRPTQPAFFFEDGDLSHYLDVATEIEYPNTPPPDDGEIIRTPAPRTIRDTQVEYRDMSLQEAVRLALKHSKVLRDLGGAVLRAPDTVQTPFNPAIQETDPRFGVEAALSAFDAQFSSSLFFENNDRRSEERRVGKECRSRWSPEH